MGRESSNRSTSPPDCRGKKGQRGLGDRGAFFLCGRGGEREGVKKEGLSFREDKEEKGGQLLGRGLKEGLVFFLKKRNTS